jgi:hypothetical protein
MWTSIDRRTKAVEAPNCRAGRHVYGPAQHVGGGLIRRICIRCDAVSIDLTAADEPAGDPSLFNYSTPPIRAS